MFIMSLCLLLVVCYFFMNVIKLNIDGTVIGGEKVIYSVTSFELFNGTSDIDKEYISNAFSLGLLIIPICILIVSIALENKVKKIINACLFIVMIAIFIYCFVHFYNLYDQGIAVSDIVILKTRASFTIWGYFYIILMAFGGTFSIIDYIKNK